MNISKKRGMAMIVAAATLAATASLVASPAFAATSAGSVYLVDYDLATTLPSTGINWHTDNVGLSLNATGYNTGFVQPAGTATVQAFLSNVGAEDSVLGWLGSQPTDAFLLNNATPDTLSDNPNVSGDFHSLLAAGGSWSLGVAFVGADNSYKGGYFTTITIVAGSPTMSYVPPAAAVAPVITTSPASVTKVVGETATFTAAASGTPTPTVKWQSAPSGSSTFTDIAGATSTTLTVANVQAADSGKKYQAVFTNGGGSVTSSAAVLTVTAGLPTEPTGAVAGGTQGNVAVANGAASVDKTLTGITAGTSYSAYGWSTPTSLGNVLAGAGGAVTVPLTGLTPGTHTIALTPVGASNVVAWFTVTIAGPANSSDVNLTVDVTTSNKFALEGVAAAVYLGSAARGATTAAVPLPAFTVTDDRDSLPGWNLTSSVADFVNATAPNAGDVIDKAALAILPRKVGAAIAGINVNALYTGSASNLFAEGLVNSSTPSVGTQFDALLAFTVPTTAKKGTYASVLTLTLTSK